MDNIFYGSILAFMLLVGILFILYRDAMVGEKLMEKLPRMKAFVINLDKNLYKWKLIEETYPLTDVQKIPMERFPAVVGTEVDTRVWLNAQGIQYLQEVETQGYRTHHYQLSRGAIGCFVSHYQLAKKLLTDPDNDMYLILEDDAGLRKDTLREIQQVLTQVPDDWDILLVGYHRVEGVLQAKFTKVTGFWGTYGYLLNKKGAQRFVQEVDATKIDAQIDAYLSWMSQTGKINLYASHIKIIAENNVTNRTDILVKLMKKDGVDPYVYKGFHV